MPLKLSPSKKLRVSCCYFLITVSCSESENDFLLPVSNDSGGLRPGPVIPKAYPNKLSKVVIFPGQTYEKRLYFYPNGLLKRVANHSGVTYQTYIYDSNNNLINVISSTPSTFTYGADNHITSDNGAPVVYDAVNNKYIFYYTPANDYDWPDRREVSLSSELLLTSDTTYYTTTDDNQNFTHYYIQSLQAGYIGTNMIYYNNPSNPSGPSYTHDDKVNPLKAAMLPVCRALCLTSHDFMDGIYKSSNKVVTNGYGFDDPESEVFDITYNANNRPISTVLKSYYFESLESTRVYAQYYYQTNTLPNSKKSSTFASL